MGSPVIPPPIRDQEDLFADIHPPSDEHPKIPPPRNERPMLQANNPPPIVEELNIPPPRDDHALMQLEIPPLRDYTSCIQEFERFINE